MTPDRNTKKSGANRINQVNGSLVEAVPHLAAWFADEEDFRELRLKLKEDGTVLAVAKGYFPDGGKAVCFGVGYGFVGALLAIDATINGGNWKVDKPWAPPGSGKEG